MYFHLQANDSSDLSQSNKSIFNAEISTRHLEPFYVLIQCCGYIYTNYSPVGTCNPGINRASFSIKRSCSTPALRMDLVIPPGPGPTSQTWAFFSSPACLTILSAKHKAFIILQKIQLTKINSLFIVKAQVCLSQNRHKQWHIPVKPARLYRIQICFTLQDTLNYLKNTIFSLMFLIYIVAHYRIK